jgi:hypothetical protein
MDGSVTQCTTGYLIRYGLCDTLNTKKYLQKTTLCVNQVKVKYVIQSKIN